MRSFPGLLKSFQWSNLGGPVDKAIVVQDADGREPNSLLARMEAKISGRSYPFPVKFAVVVQKLEAWLLADEVALERVTGEKTPVHNPEEITDPKAKLTSALSLPYTHRVAARIAAHIKLDTLEQRCGSFRTFRQAVLDC